VKVDEFIQADRLAASTVKSVVAGEGFCKGVCMDWARRILQGGKVRFSGTGLDSQTHRQAEISLVIDHQDARQKEVAALNKELTALYNEAVRAKKHELTIPVGTHTKLLKYRESLGFVVSRTMTYHMDDVDKWTDTLSALQDTCNHRTAPGWAALVHTIDNYHLEQRRKAAKKKPTRPFSHIEILESKAPESYSSVADALSILIRLPAFDKHTVMLLGFGLTKSGTKSGHAVAVYKRNDGKFLMLDPNYGVFGYDVKGLISALGYLFAGSKTLGGPIYGEDDTLVTCAVSHIIFGSA